MHWFNGFHRPPHRDNNRFHIVYQAETQFSHPSKETSNLWLPTVLRSFGYDVTCLTFHLVGKDVSGVYLKCFSHCWMIASVNVAHCAREIVVFFSPVILFLVTKTISSWALLCLVTSNKLQFFDHHLHLPKVVQQTKAIMIWHCFRTSENLLPSSVSTAALVDHRTNVDEQYLPKLSKH